MTKRDIIEQTAVGGSAGLFATVLFIICMKMDVKPGEWLQFAAVFLGVIATIGGSQLIQGQEERRRKRERAQNAISELVLVEAILKQIIDNPRTNPVRHINGLSIGLSNLAYGIGALDSRSMSLHTAAEGMRSDWETREKSLLQLGNNIEQFSDGGAVQPLIRSCWKINDFTSAIRCELMAMGHSMPPAKSPVSLRPLPPVVAQSEE